MSAYTGKQALGIGAKGRNKGAQARHRAQKHTEAVARNEQTAPERRRQARLSEGGAA